MRVTTQQEVIVEAALGLLESGGPAALRVRDIAANAGCTTMTVYSRFGGKNGVLEAVYLDGFKRFTQALQANDSGSSDDRILGLGLAYRDWALVNAGSYMVMFTEAVPGFSPSDDASAVALGAFQVLVNAVEALQAAGSVRHTDSIGIAWALWGVTHGLVMLELSHVGPLAGGVDARSVYLNSIHAMLRGFAP